MVNAGTGEEALRLTQDASAIGIHFKSSLQIFACQECKEKASRTL